MQPRFKLNHLCLAVLAASPSALFAAETSRDENVVELHDIQVVATAEEELKQASGVSIISAEDIKKRPPVNDLSEIIRKMPGVNLTGNSASGTRGNNRQICLLYTSPSPRD